MPQPRNSPLDFRMANFSRCLLMALLLGLLSVNFFSFFGHWWPLELATHFRVQYLLVSGFLIFIFLISKNRAGIALALVIFITNLVIITPLYYPARHFMADQPLPSIKLLHINVRQSNRDYLQTLQYIQAINPDILTLAEINRAWYQSLTPLAKNWLYELTFIDEDYSGIGIWSKYPIDEEQSRSFDTNPRAAIIVAAVQLPYTTLTVITTHPWPPEALKGFTARNQAFNQVIQLAQNTSPPYLIVGDLNVTSWSPYFQRLVHSLPVTDSRQGFGLQPSWPTWSRFWLIPIDHALVSEGITVLNRQIGPQLGSDHYPVLLEFNLPEI